MEAPNVLLVVLDTARADVVEEGSDTAFAQLGRRGRRFSRAIAPAPWTLPSHASLFSGLRPSEHGITGAAVLGPDGRVGSPSARVRALADRWLPDVLRRKSYSTFAASANPWVGDAMGLTLGFETVFDSWRVAPLPKLGDPLRAGSGRSGVRRWARAATVYGRRAAGVGDGGATASLEAFASWVRDAPPPFFAFFNVMEPHAPYAPPRKHRGRRVLAGMRAVRSWNAERMFRYCVGREEISSEDLGLLRELYRGEISYSDAWLARLLSSLDGPLDDTVVIVTSDHGENLGEHHLLSHVLSMHETLLRVPLAMAGPGVEAGIEENPVGLTSLAETIRSLVAGAWVDPAARPPVSEYESASAHVSGARRLEDQVGGATPELLARLRATWFASYEGRFKLAASSVGEERLVDLDADPSETTDVSSTNPDVVERLRKLEPTWSEPQASLAALDAEITSHLEGLGYL